MNLTKSFTALLLSASFPLALTAGSAQAAAIHNGLLSYWALDGNGNDTASSFTESTGIVTDNLTEAGTAGAAQIFGSGGKFGGAGDFERSTGTDGRLAAANSVDVDQPGDDITISLWAKFENDDTNWQAMISKGEGNNYRVAINDQTAEKNQASYVGGIADIVGTTNIQDGEWHHIVAVTTNGVSTALYVDGVLEASQSSGANITATSNELWIGNNPDSSSRMWDGQLDDVAIWGRPLGLEEVEQIYSAGDAGQSLAQVPEPGSLALLTLGGLLVLRRRRD